jgi:glycosyltransferase involved in cell wall biosynthesis
MKLAFVTQPWAVALPPSESVAVGTKAIAERLAGEHEPVVWSRRPEGAEGDVVEADGVEYRFVSGRGDYRVQRLAERLPFTPRRPLFATHLSYPSFHLQVALGLRGQRPDAIRVSNFARLPSLFRRACPSARIVLSMHCEWLTQLDRSMVAKRLADADVIVGVSNFVTDRIREAFPRYAERCVTVHNGADVERFAPVARESPPDRVRILTTGRVSPEKGTHVLLEAFSRVAVGRPELELHVVGKEGLPPRDMLLDLDRSPRVQALAPLYRDGYLERLRASLPEPVRGRVHFHDWTAHADLPDLYAQADVFAFPSVWDEPFGIPVAEAMAAGLPVVATRAGGIPELVVDGVTGLLAEPGEAESLAAALETLADDVSLRAAFGEAGRSRAVERFSWDRAAESYRTIFGEGRDADRIPDPALGDRDPAFRVGGDLDARGRAAAGRRT